MNTTILCAGALFPNLNHPVVIAKVKKITGAKKAKFINRGDDKHKLFLDGEVFLYHDRHLHYPNTGHKKAIKEFLDFVKSVHFARKVTKS